MLSPVTGAKMLKYYEESSRTGYLHGREHSHGQANKLEDNPLWKHDEVHHLGVQGSYSMCILRKHSKPLSRQMHEATEIECSEAHVLLNSKGEYNGHRVPWFKSTEGANKDNKVNQDSRDGHVSPWRITEQRPPGAATPGLRRQGPLPQPHWTLPLTAGTQQVLEWESQVKKSGCMMKTKVEKRSGWETIMDTQRKRDPGFRLWFMRTLENFRMISRAPGPMKTLPVCHMDPLDPNLILEQTRTHRMLPRTSRPRRTPFMLHKDMLHLQQPWHLWDNPPPLLDPP